MGGKVKKERLLDGTKNYCYQISYVAILFGRLAGLRRAPLRYGSLPRRTGGKGTKPFAARALFRYLLNIKS